MKALIAYNTEAITRFHQRKVHNTEIVETPQDDCPGPPVPENDLPDLPERDLDIPDDPNLDFVNSQCHSSEDLDQALQAYQAYQVPCPQDSTMTPERSTNHHFTYHIAQASQAKHGSLVDRGANGGLAGSDVRILSRSSRNDRIPSTTPGAEPPRDAKDSGSARSHSTHHLVTYMEPHTVPTYMSVKGTRRTLRMPSFTRAPHAQPSLNIFTRRDSDFGKPTRSRGTTRLEQNFPTSPQNKKTKLTHRSLYMSLRTISTPHVN